MTPKRGMLEVCVETVAGLEAALRGGADRIELCAALSVGGLTPPGSLIRATASGPLPVHLLARPRAGGFRYNTAEQALIADDIRAAADAGLAGVVIGASAADRQLDTAVLARWVDHARTLGQQRGAALSLTLHRAFDLVPDPLAALEQAVALGFDRILTSGGEPRAIDGVTTLAALHRQAAGRIIILAGSGISVETAPALLATGITELHASCRSTREIAPDAPERRFGFVAAQDGDTDVDRVAALAQLVHFAA
ncbi:copper homeostasis protein CutC [Sphingomonas echinoides]|uniref:PF03932 family protein CutC n=1 Tax=Sphingomonas echinoides TaxID=59803 RepID=A0ABU4PQ65_9SPHN|nr:copper homeostasis protein CutC [Sphingomonas echinoides]MDX5986089.1 copper homeostasis protein CutC [Sphingomonas echinoides]